MGGAGSVVPPLSPSFLCRLHLLPPMPGVPWNFPELPACVLSWHSQAIRKVEVQAAMRPPFPGTDWPLALHRLPGMPALWLFLSLLLLGGPQGSPLTLVQASLVSRCRGPVTDVCNFVCDCWDCSDENECGYQKVSVSLGTPFTCDFEGTACGWEDVSTTAYRWAPAEASISTWGAEPPFDHTLGTDLGWFMSTSKQRAKPSATALLRSPLMREAAATCEIRAWYYLWGAGLDKDHQPVLTVQLKNENSTVTLWRSPPSSAHLWRELVAYTGRISGPFRITFSATQGFSETMQVALDDVEFRNCGPPRPLPCGSGEQPCEHGACVAEDRFCDGTEDCWDGQDERDCGLFSTCSFEEDLCDWTVLPNTTLSWERSSSLQMAPSLVWPTRDHGSNSQAGFFVYVNNIHLGLRGGKAWLLSPVLRANGSEACYLVLYTHLYGSSTHGLNISYWTGETMKLLQSRRGSLGDYWFREKVDFNVTGNFQIVIEGVIEAGQKGSLAVDDLILSPGCIKVNETLLEPDEPVNKTLCAPDRFPCANNMDCISLELLCNFHPDCDDGSDESSCGSTDFASGPGGWMDVSVGRLRWTVQRDGGWQDSVGSTFTLQEGPGQMLSLAQATTPALGPSGSSCALHLEFTTGPQGLLALAVTDEGLHTQHWLWYAVGNGTSEWAQATVPLGARDRPFQFMLLGMAELVAVGSISFVGCNASDPLTNASGLSCNFEENWCGWFMEQNGGFQWERSTSRAWGVDHTTGTGFFLSVDAAAAAPGSQGLASRLTSPRHNSSSCFSFWYRMEGPQIGTLNLLVKPTGKAEQVLWTRTGSQGAVWHRVSSTVAAQDFQVIFEAVRNGFLGTMSLDDITLTPGTCGAQAHCSFEADDCGLLPSKQQAWMRQDGTGGRGPPFDHSLGTAKGHYMFINTSADALPSGQTATLQAGPFPPLLHSHCVTFWYFLSVRDQGSLSVSVEEGSSRRATLSPDRMLGDSWNYGQLSVTVQGKWKVVFAAKGAGEGPSSYLALDDVQVKEGQCPEAGSCNFESGPCGWSKPRGEWYSWDWKKGATPSESRSPREDHTLGTQAGHYAYVDVAVLGKGETAARLASEPLPPTEGACLQFHYHMDFLGQRSQAALRLLVSGAQGERTVWQAVGHQSRSWLNQTLLVSSLTEFQVVLEATGGARPISGTIAVDDVWYTPGPACHETQELQGEGGSSGESSDGELAGALVGVLLGLVVVAVIAAYFLKQRSASRSRLPEETTSVQGFDNLTFRDDTVIIPRLPVGPDAE